MRNEEKSRNYTEDGKNAIDSAKEKLKSKEAKIAIAGLVVLIAISVLAHFFG